MLTITQSFTLLMLAGAVAGCHGGETCEPACTGSSSTSSGGHDDAGPATSLVGTVLAASWPGAYYVAEAEFGACSRVDIAPCYLLTCAAPAGNRAHAGTITITGGSTSPITLAPLADGTYPLPDSNKSLWDGGESLTFAATGSTDGVGAFQGSLVTLPSATEPTLNGAAWPEHITPIPIDTAAALSVGWALPAPASVDFEVEASTPTSSTSGYCTFPGAAGSGSIPPDLLAHLPKGNASFVLVTRAESVVPAGSYSVTLIAETWATTVGKRSAIAKVTLH